MLLVVRLVRRGLLAGVVREARVGLDASGRVARALAASLAAGAGVRAHAREVLSSEDRREDGALELTPRVELLEAVHRLLPVHHARDPLAVLRSNNNTLTIYNVYHYNIILYFTVMLL